MSKYKIPFNVPTTSFFNTDLLSGMSKFCGDGLFTKKCQAFIEVNFNVHKALLTTSCTHALEEAALLLDIKTKDEIIMPSYTFVSTANAFVLRGAKPVFIDVRPDTMNIDENKIESAITEKTKAIVPVHYAGVGCEMDKILQIAKKHNLKVVEDAAQGVMAYYKGKALGSIGEMGAYSFHETKNYHSGEGGALLLNDPVYVERAEIIREKGTNRSRFFRGQVDKYTWVDVGSSFLPSELNAAYLWGQLESAQLINENRLSTWNKYFQSLKPLSDQKRIDLPVIPNGIEHNAHMFYLKTKDLSERTSLISFLAERGIQATFHYVPLHSSPAGLKFGRFHGEDKYTTKESDRLVRLPLWYGMNEGMISEVVSAIESFYQQRANV